MERKRDIKKIRIKNLSESFTPCNTSFTYTETDLLTQMENKSYCLKDTVLIPQGEEVELLVEFTKSRMDADCHCRAPFLEMMTSVGRVNGWPKISTVECKLYYKEKVRNATNGSTHQPCNLILFASIQKRINKNDDRRIIVLSSESRGLRSVYAHDNQESNHINSPITPNRRSFFIPYFWIKRRVFTWHKPRVCSLSLMSMIPWMPLLPGNRISPPLHDRNVCAMFRGSARTWMCFHVQGVSRTTCSWKHTPVLLQPK